jgi:hypothetical protein
VGVEFRLGRQDGHKAEDFLARHPAGVSAITLDTIYARYQQEAADAARDADVDVLFDPATERMADLGFDPPGVPYVEGEPFDVNALATRAAARTRLVEGVVEAHPDVTSIITPPHFHVHDDRSASLNIALAEQTVHQSDKPVRAALIISRKFAVAAAERLAQEYAGAGITALDLRVTPLGGDNESVAKIRSVFGIADRFAEVGIEVVLGFSGNIGQAAVALGHVAHYSVGVGLREQVNHTAAITRQKTPLPERPDDSEGNGRFGAVAGIYLPGPAITVGRKAGKALLDNTDIRTRIGCRIGSCGNSVSGPAVDPREHYLHARAHEMDALMTRPSAWRATVEIDRLRRALELRELINAHYLTPEIRPLKTRTLESLINDIEVERAMTA